MENKQIAERLGVRRHTVGKWRSRFVAHGETALFDGRAVLHDAPRSGRTRDADAVAEVLRMTTQKKPPGGAAQWSTRTLAVEVGVSRTLVQRVARARAALDKDAN